MAMKQAAPRTTDAGRLARGHRGRQGVRASCKQALGEDLHRTFTAIKQSEYLRVARTVSELDYHLYLHEV